MKDQDLKGKNWMHAAISAFLSTVFLYFLHHLPVNQIFIDPFSEAIKNHDIMDVALSKFRKHDDPALFEKDIFLINSETNDRKTISEALNILKTKSATAIGVDLLFDIPKDPVSDSLLAAALDRKQIVLGYTFEERADHYSMAGSRSDKKFTGRTSSAYVNLGSNDGFSVRAFEPFHMVDNKRDTSFAVKLASLKDPGIIKTLTRRNLSKEWINFRRKQTGKVNFQYPVNSEGLNHYPTVSISEFIAQKESYPDDYFRGKIVLIGFMGENSEAFSMKDRYFTPLNEKYTGRSMPDMHGMAVHANIISMLLSGDFIYELKEPLLYLAAFVIFWTNFLWFGRIVRKNLFFTVATVRIIQVLQFVLLFSVAVYLIAAHNIKFSFILVITAVILSFELYEYYHNRLQKRIDNHIFKKSKNKNEEHAD